MSENAPILSEDGKTTEHDIPLDDEDDDECPFAAPESSTKPPTHVSDSDEMDDDDKFFHSSAKTETENRDPFSPKPSAPPAQTNGTKSGSFSSNSSGHATSKPQSTNALSTNTYTKIPIQSPPQTSDIRVSISDPTKKGDGMKSYMVYCVVTKTSLSYYKNPETSVFRRFSDFLGLHEKLVAKHLCHGHIIPPPPEKDMIGTTKVKMSKGEDGNSGPDSSDFIERRRAALERFINRVVNHSVFVSDPDVRDFLEQAGDLPRATNTSALSGAGVKRLLDRLGDSVNKMTFKIDETDQWFADRHEAVEVMEQSIKRLHTSLEGLVNHRRELALSTVTLGKSVGELGTVEDNLTLTDALNKLRLTEENLGVIYGQQADKDFYILSETAKDYVALLGAVKQSLYERTKCFKAWKDAEANLTKRHDEKTKFEAAQKTEKILQADTQIKLCEERVADTKTQFSRMSETLRKELDKFEDRRVGEFKQSIIDYLTSLMETEKQVLNNWQLFLPKARSITSE